MEPESLPAVLPADRLTPASRAALALAPADAMGHAVFRTMCGTDAKLERFAWLGDGLAAAVWERHTDEHETVYSQPGHHTLSCYLGGGYRVERNGTPGQFGAPQRLCSLPDWHESRWIVRDSLRLLHLYFMPEHFTRRAVIELDREPRELMLQDRTYFDNAELAATCLSLLDAPWLGADGLLRANEITHDALSRLLHDQAAVRPSLKLKGGLAPYLRRRVAEWIDAHLHETITLGRLAELACLSEFHLVRMFGISFGMPPAAWIAARRIDRARLLLKGGSLPLQHVAEACGYADVSHFTHRFKAAVGVPPGRYRQLMA
jgi:AraC family transcriptional regulator